jgi:hypothetical protein
MTSDTKREMTTGIIAMVVGYAWWVLPALLIPGNDVVRLPLLMSDDQYLTDRSSAWYTILIGLFLSSVVGGAYARHYLVFGSATMLLPFIITTLDAVLGLHNHKLIGVEWIIYAALSLIGIAGAMLGHYIRKFVPIFR